MKSGSQLIAEERQRQITAKGWTPEHDDKHDAHELIYAAKAFLYSALGKIANANLIWPFKEAFKPSRHHPKPKSQGGTVDDLIKAGALIAAEIDRITRRNPDYAPSQDENQLATPSLINAASAALCQLEHLHGANKCLSPGNCPTLSAIQNLTKALQDEYRSRQKTDAERINPAVDIAPIDSVYGRCPRCGAPGVSRERRIDGNDKCANGHVYPSRDAKPAEATYPPMEIKDIDSK